MPREKVQASKESSFVWSDDEMELLLDITNEYRAQKMLSGFDWEVSHQNMLTSQTGS